MPTSIARLAAAALGMVLLASCATSEPELTLAESKSPAQLLRNEAQGRIPDGVIQVVEKTSDTSIPCGSESEREAGLMRMWQSLVTLTLTPDASAGIDGIVDAMVDSYLSQGWTDRSLGGTPVDYERFLYSETTSAILRITAKHFEATGDEEQTDASKAVFANGIEIEVRGPCVRTDGPDSAEVIKLEES